MPWRLGGSGPGVAARLSGGGCGVGSRLNGGGGEAVLLLPGKTGVMARERGTGVAALEAGCDGGNGAGVASRERS